MILSEKKTRLTACKYKKAKTYMMTINTKIGFLLTLLILTFWHTSCAALTEEAEERRDKVRYALEKGLISRYDIPFKHYADLEMWAEIDSILRDNNRNILKYRLPGQYYSRPYVVGDSIWIFPNTGTEDANVHIFRADTLEYLTALKNEEFGKYGGGIRAVFNGRIIISGGSDQDVDTAVVWDTRTHKLSPLTLEDGHYVSAVAADADKLCVGSCGGKVNAWEIDSRRFLGSYSTSRKKNTSWEVFNQKACISAIHFFNDRLIGAGEKQVFVWNMADRSLVRQYDKALNNSLVFFYEGYMAEFKNERFVIRSLEDEEEIRSGRAERSIVDLIITSEILLPEQAGPVIVVAQRHNKGMQVFDFETLELLNTLPFKGETLRAYKGRLFATDDRFVYQYDIRKRRPEPYRRFLKTVNLDDLRLNDDLYKKLLSRAREYPNVIHPNTLSRKFLAQYNLSLDHAFRYRKIGEQMIRSDDGNEYKEEVLGYKLKYEVRNRADTGYYITLICEWSGAYGEDEAENAGEKSSHRESFFIPPGGGTKTGMVTIGEREPARFFIYPATVEEMSEAYYNGLTNVLKKGNADLSAINRYLRDKRFRKWHPELKKKKADITVRNSK